MADASNDELNKLLECPVCFERLTPPIETCENGHGICKNCRKSVETCGVCRKKFSSVKNTLLNQIAETVTVNCKYRSKGCIKTLKISMLDNHENICYYREKKCISCKKQICTTEMNDHFKICKSLRRKSEKEWGIGQGLSQAIRQDKNNTYFAVYITNIETYFLVRLMNNSQKTIICVQYMGKDQENAKKFKFEIKIDQGLSPPNKCDFCCNGLCIPYFYSIEDTMKQKGLIELDFKSIFLNDDYLKTRKFVVNLKLYELS